MSISPEAGQFPYLPHPEQSGLDPSSGSIQNAGHNPAPEFNLIFASILIVLYLSEGDMLNLPKVRILPDVKRAFGHR
jgi:hypothetical protein